MFLWIEIFLSLDDYEFVSPYRFFEALHICVGDVVKIEACDCSAELEA